MSKQKRTFTLAEANEWRDKASSMIRAHRVAAWDLAEVLYAASEYVTEVGEIFYKAWGYTSFTDYVRSEVLVSISYASTLKMVWAKFQVEETSPRLRELAKAIPLMKLKECRHAVRKANTESWLSFAAAHTTPEVIGAARIAESTPALRDDPEKAFARYQRSKQKSISRSSDATAFRIPLTSTSKPVIAMSVATARRALRDESLSSEKCLIEVLKQFNRLVVSGRAGDGWNLGETCDQAAE